MGGYNSVWEVFIESDYGSNSSLEQSFPRDLRIIYAANESVKVDDVMLAFYFKQKGFYLGKSCKSWQRTCRLQSKGSSGCCSYGLNLRLSVRVIPKKK